MNTKMENRGMIDDTYRDSFFWKLFSGAFEKAILLIKKYPKVPGNARALFELKESARNMKLIDQTDSEANNDWIKHSNSMIRKSLEDNPEFFLRWHPVKDTMNVTNSKFILYELNYLKRKKSWKSFWKKFIPEPWIGGQIPFVLYPKSSGNSIHLAYVMSQFIEKTGKSFKDFDFIFEFGGGYGNLCRLIHKFGYKGKYSMYDFPIVSAFQEYYLSSAGLKVKEMDSEKVDEDYINCTADINTLLDFLNRNTPSNGSRNLFVATWSLSESPLDVRKYFDGIFEKFDYFLMGYQDKFGEVDNKDYFRKLKNSRKDIEWFDWPVGYLPAHNFLIGRKKQQ